MAQTLDPAAAHSAGSVVSLDRLTEVVWGAQPPADPRKAVQTGVARLRERLGDRAPPSTGAEHERLQASLRIAHRRLGDDRFAAAQAAGRQLDARETVDHALGAITRLLD